MSRLELIVTDDCEPISDTMNALLQRMVYRGIGFYESYYDDWSLHNVWHFLPTLTMPEAVRIAVDNDAVDFLKFIACERFASFKQVRPEDTDFNDELSGLFGDKGLCYKNDDIVRCVVTNIIRAWKPWMFALLFKDIYLRDLWEKIEDDKTLAPFHRIMQVRAFEDLSDKLHARDSDREEREEDHGFANNDDVDFGIEVDYYRVTRYTYGRPRKYMTANFRIDIAD